MGFGVLLKERNPDVRIIAVEPEDSQGLSGGTPGQHMIEGIGAGFVPSILDTNLIDEVIPIANETAFWTARQTAALEDCLSVFQLVPRLPRRSRLRSVRR